jgi:hypothetical protein
VLEGTGRSPLPFDVTGFMSAGEEVRIRRDFGTGHARMGVKFDSRIVGFPEAAGRGPLRQISWRIVGDGMP